MKHLKSNETYFTDTLKKGLYVDNILTSFDKNVSENNVFPFTENHASFSMKEASIYDLGHVTV